MSTYRYNLYTREGIVTVSTVFRPTELEALANLRVIWRFDCNEIVSIRDSAPPPKPPKVTAQDLDYTPTDWIIHLFDYRGGIKDTELIAEALGITIGLYHQRLDALRVKKTRRRIVGLPAYPPEVPPDILAQYKRMLKAITCPKKIYGVSESLTNRKTGI